MDLAPTATSPRPRANRRGDCVICNAPYKAQIHALRASGMDYQAISVALRASGRTHKRQTLANHFRGCLKGELPTLDMETARQIADGVPGAGTQAEADFATLVQRRAVRLMGEGSLRITTKDGLQAQALLDRRLEKQADRDLALNMARLLSGSISMVPLTVIEGRAIEVLAPPDLIAPRDA